MWFKREFSGVSWLLFTYFCKQMDDVALLTSLFTGDVDLEVSVEY